MSSASLSPTRTSAVSASSAKARPAWPDLGRADVGLLLTSRWRVTSVVEPRQAAERAALAWSQSSTPAGLLASNVFISADDRALMRISQWRDDEAPGGEAAPTATSAGSVTGSTVVTPAPLSAAAAPASKSQQRARAIVPVSEPAVEHLGTRIYRPYRSGIFRGQDEEPGALFVVELDLGEPGRAQDWVELIFSAVEADGRPPPGLLAGHFYVSDDGRRAVNLAEWSSSEAHAEAIKGAGGFMGGGAGWERARLFAEGRVKSEHYTFLRSTSSVT